MQSKKYPLCEAAYLFYYASDVAFEEGADMGKLRRRLVELIGDALIISYKVRLSVSQFILYTKTFLGQV